MSDLPPFGPLPCWKGWRAGDRVRVLAGMIPGTIFCLPPKMSPHRRATVSFDHPDEHGHDCCFCTQAEMVRDHIPDVGKTISPQDPQAGDLLDEDTKREAYRVGVLPCKCSECILSANASRQGRREGVA